jgi:hypothetical protein
LCVSLDIDEYPSVIHYQHQKRFNAWLGGAPGLVRWIKQELEPPKRRVTQQRRPLASMERPAAEGLHQATEGKNALFAEAPSCKIGAASGSTEKSSVWQWQVARSVCFLTLLLALAVRCWALLAHAHSRANAAEARPPVSSHGSDRKVSAVFAKADDSSR